MYKIGDFSQLGQVTVRALRHYDRLNLLKPGHTDRFTNYRYYTADQLPRLNRILALRDLGFSLEKIGELLDTDLTVDEMRSLLAERQREVEQQLREESARLRRIATRLKHIEQAGTLAHYDIIVKPLPAVSLFAVRDVVPHVDAMGEYRERLLTQLYAWVEELRIPYGQELVIYHNRSYTMENIEMSIGVEVEPTTALPTDAPPNVRKLDLPATAQAASIVHHGPIPDIPDVVSSLYGWLGMNSYTSAGAYREIHLFGRELELFINCTDDEFRQLNLVYEILLPIEKF